MNKLELNLNEINHYLKKLFPITRSITGEGNRKTLKILQEIIPLKIIEYPTGQRVYDWTIPKEWNIKDAWIKDKNGNKIINFKDSNLHVVSYSIPIHKKMTFKELKEHLHYREDLPDAIPYRTSYYNENWGFCLSYNQFKNLNQNEEYEVFIDGELKDGNLSIGELLIEGKSKKEYLISSYICHPSMANDSLSGFLTATYIARELLNKQNLLEFSYRILFVPETIGAIAYCANNEDIIKKIDNGLVVTTCGGAGTYGYKQSWQKDNWINQLVEDIFKEEKINYATYPFAPDGSDERQYSAYPFRINCVTITKDKYYEYDFYHTSLDNLDFVKPNAIKKTIELYLKLINKMDKNIVYKPTQKSEIMLSKRDLYPKISGHILPNVETELMLISWILFKSNGKISLYEISKELKVDISDLYKIAEKLVEKEALKKIE